MKLFVFGLGFSATAAVNRLGPSCFKEGGWVAATCRSEEKAETIRSAGLRAHIFSGEEAGNEQMRTDLQEATHILMSISPGADDPVRQKGTQPGHMAVEVVAGARVERRVDRVEPVEDLVVAAQKPVQRA